MMSPPRPKELAKARSKLSRYGVNKRVGIEQPQKMRSQQNINKCTQDGGVEFSVPIGKLVPCIRQVKKAFEPCACPTSQACEPAAERHHHVSSAFLRRCTGCARTCIRKLQRIDVYGGHTVPCGCQCTSRA